MGAVGARGSAAVLVEALGISPVVADAIDGALAQVDDVAPGCQVRLALVAAVVEDESSGGRGRAISPQGDVEPRIIGEALDGGADGSGRAKALVRDSDAGRLDADPLYDRAVGLAQFLPATWAAAGLDGNGDGVADPHNVYDAVLTQVAKLCRDGYPLASASDERRALYAYNPADWYVAKVMALAERIQAVLDAAAPAEGALIIASPSGPLQLSTAGGITVASHVAPYLQALLDAARADGVELAGSGYRSAQAQIRLRLTNGCPDVYTAPPSSCAVPTAVPGRSMHEVGEAVDFTHQGRTLTRGSVGFAWLQSNAGRFGLYNLPSEPWHWSTNAR